MFDDPLEEITSGPSTSAPPRILASHLGDLIDFAKEKGLTVGSTIGGHHNIGSKHYTGNAIDIKGSGAFSNEQVAQLQSEASSRGFKVRDERTRPKGQAVWGGPHVHIEYAGQQEQDPLTAITQGSTTKVESDPLAEISGTAVAPTTTATTSRSAYMARAQRARGASDTGSPVNPIVPAEPGSTIPMEGEMPGVLHLNPAIAPHVPKGAPRPLAPGEWIDNPNGSWSSEISATIQNSDGSWSVVPGMWIVNGKPRHVNEDIATQYAQSSGLTFPKYRTLDEAEKAATDRESVWQGVKPQEASKITPLWRSPVALTTNDAAWHFGMTPQEARKLSPRAQRVLAGAVASDNAKKAAGEAVAPPPLAYQNQMRQAAGLKPLQFNLKTNPDAPSPYYRPSTANLPIETVKPKIEVSPDSFRFQGPSDDQIRAGISQQVASEVATARKLWDQHPTGMGVPPRFDVEAETQKRFNEYQRIKAEQTRLTQQGPAFEARNAPFTERARQSINDFLTQYAPGLASLDTPLGIKTDLLRGAASGASLGATDIVLPRRSISPEERIIDPQVEKRVPVLGTLLDPYTMGEIGGAMVPLIATGGMLAPLELPTAVRTAATFGLTEASRQGINVLEGRPADISAPLWAAATGLVMGQLAGRSPGLARRVVAFVLPSLGEALLRGQSPQEAATSALTNLGFAAFGGHEEARMSERDATRVPAEPIIDPLAAAAERLRSGQGPAVVEPTGETASALAPRSAPSDPELQLRLDLDQAKANQTQYRPVLGSNKRARQIEGMAAARQTQIESTRYSPTPRFDEWAENKTGQRLAQLSEDAVQALGSEYRAQYGEAPPPQALREMPPLPFVPKEGVTNAVSEGQIQNRNEAKLRGTQQGPNVPAYGGEIGQESSGQAAGRDRSPKSGQVQQGEVSLPVVPPEPSAIPPPAGADQSAPAPLGGRTDEIRAGRIILVRVIGPNQPAYLDTWSLRDKSGSEVGIVSVKHGAGGENTVNSANLAERGQGYGRDAYRALADHYGHLQSDSIQSTDAALKAWRALGAEELPDRSSDDKPRYILRATRGGDRRQRQVLNLREERRSLKEQRDIALRAAETDALTGLGNRAALDKALPTAEADPNTSVIVFDANNLGIVNKMVEHGQTAGDTVIQKASEAIKQAAQENGVPGRIFRRGGDEFVALVPKEKADAVRSRAEQIMGEQKYEGTHGQTNEKTSARVSLTGSVGENFKTADEKLQGLKAKQKTPAVFQHRDFGQITESPDQSGVRKKFVRVVDSDGNAHVIKRVNLRGQGNNLAVPIRTVPEDPNITERSQEIVRYAESGDLASLSVVINEAPPEVRTQLQGLASEIAKERSNASSTIEQPAVVPSSEASAEVPRPNQNAQTGPTSLVPAEPSTSGAATTEGNSLGRWSDVWAEVKRRADEVGPVLSGGSAVYDVNKYPKGGLADHAKLAHMLEPVMMKLRSDAAALVAAGKLKADDVADYIRTTLASDPYFQGWNPINKRASMAIVARENVPPSSSIDSVRNILRNVHDFVSIEPIPNLKRARVAGEARAHASARVATPYVVRDILSQVFPDQYADPAAMAKTIDVINKDNILGGYDTFMQRGMDAQIKAATAEATEKAAIKHRKDMDKNPPAGLTPKEIGQLKMAATTAINQAHSQAIDSRREAVAWLERAAQVGDKQDIAQLEADVNAAQGDPQIVANINRWKTIINPEMDRLYNEAKRIDPNTPQTGRGRIFGARINLLPETRAAEMAAFSDPNRPMPEAVTSNYRNPNVKRDPFMRAAKFTGAYSTDAQAVLTNVLGPRLNEVTKLRLFDALVAQGVAVESAGSEDAPDLIQGQKPVSLAIKVPQTTDSGTTMMVERNLWVRKDLAREVRDVLNTDMPLPSNPVSKFLTQIQLAQLTDATAHLKNIHTILASAPATRSVWTDAVRRLPILGSIDSIGRIIGVTRQVLSDSPEIRSELAGMAQQGLVRPEYPPTGIQKVLRGQQLIHSVDTASRVIMNRFFDNLVARGSVADTPENRASFVQQVGEYNRRLMGPFMRAARDSGLSPFVVAGRNFNRQAVRLLTGNPGVEASDNTEAAKMRGVNLATGLVAATVLPALLNTVTTGSMGGRPGTPIGAWDIGRPPDDKGKHRVIDLFQILGIRRGLRATGINALVEGARGGESANNMIGDAVSDVTSAQAHPWLGPALGFTYQALTGKRLDLRGGPQPSVAKNVGGGAAQYAENMRTALETQNPLLYSLISPLVGAPQGQEGDSTLTRLRKGLTKGPASAFGVQDVQSPAMKDINEKIAAMMPQMPTSGPRQIVSNEVVTKERSGQSARAELTQAKQEGILNEKDVQRLLKAGKLSPMGSKAETILRGYGIEGLLDWYEQYESGGYFDQEEKADVRKVLHRSRLTLTEHPENMRGTFAQKTELKNRLNRALGMSASPLVPAEPVATQP